MAHIGQIAVLVKVDVSPLRAMLAWHENTAELLRASIAEIERQNAKAEGKDDAQSS